MEIVALFAVPGIGLLTVAAIGYQTLKSVYMLPRADTDFGDDLAAKIAELDAKIEAMPSRTRVVVRHKIAHRPAPRTMHAAE